jgi:hypothetical protein
MIPGALAIVKKLEVWSDRVVHRTFTQRKRVDASRKRMYNKDWINGVNDDTRNSAMRYEWEVDSLTEGRMYPVPPNPSFAPSVGDIVRLKKPYNQDRFYSATGVEYSDLDYIITYVLDDVRNHPTVQCRATTEITTIVSSPFRSEYTRKPECEIQTGWLELVPDEG